ncbi:glyoxylase, partial [Vibrio cholerae HC-48B2]
MMPLSSIQKSFSSV